MHSPTDKEIEHARIRREEREAERSANVGVIRIEITASDYGDVAPELMLEDFLRSPGCKGWSVRLISDEGDTSA